MRLLFFAIITMTGIGSWNTRRKPLVCRLQNQNGIATPPLPLNAVVAQRGASLGIYQREKKRTNLRCGSRSARPARPASIANGVPFAAENGRTRAPFWFAGKRLASFAPAIPHRTGSARRFFGICCDVSRGVFPWEFQKSRRLFWGKSQIKAMIREIWEASEQHNCRCERSDKKPSRPRKGCSKSLGW